MPRNSTLEAIIPDLSPNNAFNHGSTLMFESKIDHQVTILSRYNNF